MTTIETQFESHLQSQVNRAIITGNWAQIRYLLQRPGVNASVTQEVFTDLADEIADAFLNLTVISAGIPQGTAILAATISTCL